MEYKTIVDSGFTLLIEEFQQHLQDGWEIDPDNAPSYDLLCFTIHLVKKANSPAKAGRPAKKESA